MTPEMLSTLEQDRINQILDKYGETHRFFYFSFAGEIKGNKVKTNAHAEQVIGKWKEKELNEEIMKLIAKNLRPEFQF